MRVHAHTHQVQGMDWVLMGFESRCGRGRGVGVGVGESVWVGLGLLV